MRPARVLAVAIPIALCAAAFPGCGGSGSSEGPAASNDPFYGVIAAEPLPGSSELARLGTGGVGTLRVNLAWGSVQPGADAPFDWSHYDPVVRDAAKNGIRVLATVYSSPTWAEPTPEVPPLGAALPGFEAFVKAAVERYGSNGTFWKANPDLPKLPITDWQLWNEQNSPLYWKPNPSAAQYVDLLRAFNGVVKGVDPEARILLGGLFPRINGGVPVNDFLSQIYQAGGQGLFDAAAIHPYASTPDEALGIVRGVRTVMSGAGDAAKPLWITEIGWASGGDPSWVTVGPERQAQYLSQALSTLAADRDSLKIAGVVWYSLKDTPGPIWPGHCGLFTLSDQAKPAWGALVALTGGSA